MRRAALLLALAALIAAVPAGPSGAGIVTDDVYESSFLAVDNAGRTYVVEARVDDRPAGTQLVVSYRRQCKSCRASVHVKTLKPGEWTVRTTETAGVECICFVATVETKFGGQPMRIDWIWDPEQGGGPSGDGFEWYAVTANNVLNVGCYSTGSHTETPNPFSGEEPPVPPGAGKFPEKMPEPFRMDPYRAPGCHVDSP